MVMPWNMSKKYFCLCLSYPCGGLSVVVYEKRPSVRSAAHLPAGRHQSHVLRRESVCVLRGHVWGEQGRSVARGILGERHGTARHRCCCRLRGWLYELKYRGQSSGRLMSLRNILHYYGHKL